MSISGVGTGSGLVIKSLVDMRRQLDDLQRQIGTGKKSVDYAGLGTDRGLAVGLRGQLAAIDGFNSTIKTLTVRTDIAQMTLGQIADITSEVKSATMQAKFDPDTHNQTTLKKNSEAQLAIVFGLLNTHAGDRYLFSGRSGDKPSVEDMNVVLQGDGRAGFKTVLQQRNMADLGDDGLGRLDITAPAANQVSIAEDAASPFGFKLVAADVAMPSATVTPPGGVAPQSLLIGFTAVPAVGESIKLNFALPDGSRESLTFTATASAAPGPNQFTIGADAATTAANLKTAITTQVGKLAATSLSAASGLAAAEDFFNVDAANPPQRVDGPPYDTATGLVDGTPTDTVMWYTGEASTDPVRTTAMARIDQSISVSYGMRANEEGLRWVVQNMAVLAVTEFSQTGANDKERSAALNQRIMGALAIPADKQKVQTIQEEIATAQTSVAAAKDRHLQTSSTVGNMLQEIEGVSDTDVAAKIMTLQTRLQASLQTTALMFQTSLVNYL